MNSAFPAPSMKTADHPPVRSGRVGVLIVNLGSPDAPDVPAVKRFLGEFLSDKRVIEIPSLLWQPILRLLILNLRPRTSAANYAKVWTPDGSQITAFTKAQAAALQGRFGANVTVDWAMRYGTRSIPERLRALMDAGCDRILLAPLYPQYSSATNGTVVDAANATIADWRWQPALRTLPPYYDSPDHISALAESVRAGVAGLDFEPQLIVTSFHGMPRRTLDRGDPYHCQCQKTGRLLQDALRENVAIPVKVTFQSRFGRAEWLKPYTDATLESLAEQGITRIAVVCPGFAADCLETLEEIGIRAEEDFKKAGGESLRLIPSLNAHPTWVRAAADLVREAAPRRSLPLAI